MAECVLDERGRLECKVRGDISKVNGGDEGKREIDLDSSINRAIDMNCLRPEQTWLNWGFRMEHVHAENENKWMFYVHVLKNPCS